ncbi:hypothetical protein [Calycomorphotria hydatis]|uniref:Uncharacterized protein n=1 Tax=Calycomorphotria hydatis TaxID=2528027 RepID=A0A517T3X0_9PLAN|nr:hypothetical protein [Calycomorphotria hydatis]QDT63070.1 hypothetical protein V22_02700 [Calycomorphotria hydatis]
MKNLHQIEEIWNCDEAFEFQCPQKWDELSKTEMNGVRFCDQCKERVIMCHSPEEFVRLGNAGHCVAVPESKVHHPLFRAILGRPSSESIRKFKDSQQEPKMWWESVIELKPTFAEKLFTFIERACKANRHRRRL